MHVHPMRRNWYCQLEGQASGPFTADELGFLAARGKLSPTDLVRQGDDGQWVTAQSVQGLFRGGAGREAASSSGDASSRPRTVTPPVSTSVKPAPFPEPADAPLPQAGTAPTKLPRSPLSRTKARRRNAILIGASVGAALVLAIALLLLNLRTVVSRGIAGRSDLGSNASPVGSKGNHAEGNRQAGDAEIREDAGSAESGRGSAGNGALAGTPSSQAAPAESVPDSSDTTRPADKAPTENRPRPPQSEREREPQEPRALTIRQFEEPPSADPVENLLRPPHSPRSGARRGAARPSSKAFEGMFRGRSSRSRGRLAQRGGGSKQSEAAVELGLKWLAAHQAEDGRWSLGAFSRVGECNGQCTHPGMVASDTAATGLALLPFLGAGHTPKSGDYRDVVAAGMQWLVANQNPDGSFRDARGGTMYAHGQAAIVLCETLAMTGDKELKAVADRAIEYIVAAQHTAGGWRYSPGQPGDTSVLGWQVMALRSAQEAEVHVPKQTLDRAAAYLDSAQADEAGGLYGYMPRGRRGGASNTMTAEGLLCRQYTGWRKNHSGLAAGVAYLVANLPNRGAPNMYYWYYATQVMHHMGGNAWDTWNGVMRDLLISMQETEGHQAGSWTPAAGHDRPGGRLYMTSLAICTLEVYYRHSRLYGSD